MAEPFPEGFPSERGEVTLCVFPHVREVLALDLRTGVPGRPCLRLLSVDEVLGEPFYREIEEAFSTLLREGDYPIARLLGLPARLEALVREKALSALVAKVSEDLPPSPPPRVSVVLWAGPLVGLRPPSLREVMERLVGEGVDPGFLSQVVTEVERLLEQERAVLHRMERERLRQMLRGQDPGFYTIWKSPT